MVRPACRRGGRCRAVPPARGAHQARRCAPQRGRGMSPRTAADVSQVSALPRLGKISEPLCRMAGLPLVAHALLRAAATLLSPRDLRETSERRQECRRHQNRLIQIPRPQEFGDSSRPGRRQECRRGTHECVRHPDRPTQISWLGKSPVWGRHQPAEGFSPTSNGHEICGRRIELFHWLKPARPRPENSIGTRPA